GVADPGRLLRHDGRRPRRAVKVGRGRRYRGGRARAGDRARLRRLRRVRGLAHRFDGSRQRPVPGLLHLPVHLLDEPPAQPDDGGVVPLPRNREPGLVPDRRRAESRDHRLEHGGAAARVRDRPRDRRGRIHARRVGAVGTVGAHVKARQLLEVGGAVAWRQLHNALLNPVIFIPSLAFPLLNFAAFAGGLAKVREIPGFTFDGSYTAFTFVFVLLQSAAFSGVFSGFGVARDFETGFTR